MAALSFVQKMFPPPMFMSFPCVGVDISDTSLKYIQFERAGSQSPSLRIRQWGDIEIPAGVVERGNVYDVEKLGQSLSEMKKRTGAQYVRVSLPEERAYLFETTVDSAVPEKDIRGILDFRLEENVPLSPRDAYFDYSIIGEDVENKARRVVVAVYAQTTINSYYEACTHAGVIPLSFEIEAQAIARATVPHNGDGTYMIVDFGKTRMGLGIVHNETLIYTSTIEIAGSQMSHDMRAVLGDLTESELTKIKNTKGLLATEDNKEIAEILKKYAKNIADELSIRMHYWDTRGIDKEDRSIKKVIICGGSANLFGLPEFLTSTLGVPTERAQVWVNSFPLNEYVPEISRRYSYGYATAVGLALKSFM